MTNTGTRFGIIVGCAAVAVLILSMGNAVPAQAHGEEAHTKTSTTTKEEKRTTKIEKNIKKTDAACMQTAVLAREGSLITAFGALHDDIDEALGDRKDALNTAWGLSAGKDRTKALAMAWKEWKSAQKSATDAFKKSRKSAWDTFRTTVRNTCKETLPKEESLTADTAGSLSI